MPIDRPAAMIAPVLVPADVVEVVGEPKSVAAGSSADLLDLAQDLEGQHAADAAAVDREQLLGSGQRQLSCTPDIHGSLLRASSTGKSNTYPSGPSMRSCSRPFAPPAPDRDINRTLTPMGRVHNPGRGRPGVDRRLARGRSLLSHRGWSLAWPTLRVPSSIDRRRACDDRRLPREHLGGAPSDAAVRRADGAHPAGRYGPEGGRRHALRGDAGVDRAIVFALRYGDLAGFESDVATTAAALRKYPDKFVGFAYADPRRPDCMELLRHATGDLGLKGVKYGPIYNGVALDDPRMISVYEHCVAHDLPLTMHMGTTFARNAPVDLGRAIHVEPVALRIPSSRSSSRTWATPGTRTPSPGAQAAQRLRRDLRDLLPALAVLERRTLMAPGVSDHRQDLLLPRSSPCSRPSRTSSAGIRAIIDVVAVTRLADGERPGDRAHHPRQPVAYWWHGPAPVAAFLERLRDRADTDRAPLAPDQAYTARPVHAALGRSSSRSVISTKVCWRCLFCGP